MKKKGLLYLSALLCLTVFSCSKDDDSRKNDVVEPGVPDVELGEIKRMPVHEWADSVFGKDGEITDESRLLAKENYLARARQVEDSLANAVGENGAALFVGFMNFKYWSTDELGKPILLSAFLGWGEHWWFGYEPMDQNHIRLVCPYTHTKYDECATLDEGGKEFLAMSVDDLFIMPDGEGFGVSIDRDQMYLNHELQARQIYDAMVAGYDIYLNNVEGKMESDWTLRVYGASQGAADAIAVHRFLDTKWYSTKERMCDHWNFEYSFVCCGPYSPKATMEDYYDKGYVHYPLVLPLTIKSMRASYPELAQKYPETRFYTDKYNENKELFDRYYINKELKTDDLNDKIFEKLSKKGDPDDILYLDRILSPEVLDPNSQIYKDFIDCLDKQDLTKGWTPITKTYLWWSVADEVVPDVNSWQLYHLFRDAGKCESYENMGFTHEVCCGIYIVSDW